MNSIKPTPVLSSTSSRPSTRFVLGLATAAIAAMGVTVGAGIAEAQPGATPPGSVAPYGPAPQPAPAPQPMAPQPMAPQPMAPLEPLPPQPVGPPPASYNSYRPAYPPPVPTLEQQPPQVRDGFVLGVSLGFGSMTSDAGEFECFQCSRTPVTAAFDIHAGTMISPQLSIQAEVWGQQRALDYSGETNVNQTLILVGLQYWMTEKFWVKGGLGASVLSASYYGETEQIDEGGAVMVAIGYELVHSDSFGWDIQLKSGAGFYVDELSDAEETIEATTIAMGVNWY